MENLYNLVNSARRNRKPLPHILIHTTDSSLLKRIGDEAAIKMGVNIGEAQVDDIKNPGDLAGILTNLQEGDIMLLSNIHNLKQSTINYFIPPLVNFTFDLITESGPTARSVQVALNRFTLIASVPSGETIPQSLRSCFFFHLHGSELSQMYKQCAEQALSQKNIEFEDTLPEAIERVASKHQIDMEMLISHLIQYCKEIKDIDSHLSCEDLLSYLSFAGFKETNSSSDKQSRTVQQSVRREVWHRDRGRFVECGGRERLEFDHIVPFSRGGSNTTRNIQLLCEKCNRAKGNTL